MLVADRTALLAVPDVENPARVRYRPSVDLERNPWARVLFVQVFFEVHPMMEKSGMVMF